ncbi:hypothetical protein ACFSC6_10655 [Rufibacter sediminis]|uniref:Uncharacterized protein n=1 Tax=Rufibacter sediminis TaxID=2762756 RepID=A0ABR6VP78_9BACT|nr:hypothetical protein [Rufibacter sediminis]MBC3538994.1 hypothetical protein [Rufibacter sediminis]
MPTPGTEVGQTRRSELIAGLQREIIRQLAPAVAASRLRKVARIISQDEGNRAMFGEEVRELRNRYRASVEVRQFRTYGEAANWIAAIRA